MRFKTVFLIFNVVIVVSFLFIFFMPLFMLGGQRFGEFLARNWISGALFVVALAGFNAYFVGSWRLFELLEREDWAGLIGYLEKQVYERGRLSRRSIKILINSYLVTSRTEEILRLQAHVAERRPALAARFAVPFGVPYLLLNRPADSERYFGRMLAAGGVARRGWLHWNHAFSLLQLRELDAARGEFEGLLNDHSDPILYLLSLYMLDSLARADEKGREAVREKADRFRSLHSQKSWNRRVERAKENMQVLILSRIIKEASDWLFGPPAGRLDN
jgi:hypothetical protein